tara:strand:- start:9936 stop:10406 length:471 start_codon:yes stop_codon:yes gene_type:complete
MIYFITLNFFISIVFLKLFYQIFGEKILYPFRVAEIYAYFFTNFSLFFLNFIFHSINLAFVFLLFNTLIFYIFYHLVNMIQTSPRTKILIDLLRLQKISLEEYYKFYNLKIIVDNRLKRFESSNQIKIVNEKIYFNKKNSNFLKLLSIIFTIIKKM